MPRFNLSTKAVVLFTLLFWLTGWVHGAQPEYRVGIVPQYEQRKLYRIWRPILDRLEQLSGLKFILVGTPKIPVFEQYLYEGKFDFAYMNPFHLLKANESAGYHPVINDGSRQLKGILVVHRASGITEPRQLNNKVLAMPAPNALGASLLLRAELKSKFNVDVQPKYVRTHSSVYLHVAKQLVSAGGGVRRTLEAQNESVKNELRIIHETRGIAPHPIAVHPRVVAADREKLLSALLKMGNSKADRELLARIPINQVSKTSMADYQTLSQLGLSQYYVEEEK